MARRSSGFRRKSLRVTRAYTWSARVPHPRCRDKALRVHVATFFPPSPLPQPLPSTLNSRLASPNTTPSSPRDRHHPTEPSPSLQAAVRARPSSLDRPPSTSTSTSSLPPPALTCLPAASDDKSTLYLPETGRVDTDVGPLLVLLSSLSCEPVGDGLGLDNLRRDRLVLLVVNLIERTQAESRSAWSVASMVRGGESAKEAGRTRSSWSAILGRWVRGGGELEGGKVERRSRTRARGGVRGVKLA